MQKFGSFAVELGELVKAVFGEEDERMEILVKGGEGWESKRLD